MVSNLRKKLTLPHITNKLKYILFYCFDFLKYYYLKFTTSITGSNGIANHTTTILYLGEYFPVRIQRIVRELKSKYQVQAILVISQWGYEPKLIGNHFDQIYIYRNKYQLMRIMLKLNKCSIMHAFEPKAEFQNLARLQFKNKVIYDVQDVLINYYYKSPPLKWQRQNLLPEYEMFKLSDGLISHSLELKEGLRNHQIKNNAPALFFPLFCDENNFREINYSDSNKYKIVYIGGINSIKDSNSANFAPIIEQVSKTTCEFSIYPSPFSEKLLFDEYKALEDKYSNFKMLRSVPFNSLNLSDYGFGIMPYDHPNSEKYYSKNRYASSLKLFVYLEAGIPVLLSEYWEFIAWIVKRYDLGLVVPFNKIDNLEKLISEFDYIQCKKNIEKFRNKFTLQNRIVTVKNFYEEIGGIKIADNPAPSSQAPNPKQP